ncbi:MAG: hypothetical protein V7L20_15175 [Nostoc sp.]
MGKDYEECDAGLVRNAGLLASGAIAIITNASRAMPTLVCGTAKIHKCFLGLSLANSSVTLN